MIRLMKESFVPVLLVIAGIFILVYYSNYIADMDAEQVTVIEIPVQILQQDDGLDSSAHADNDSEEEELDQISMMRNHEPEFDSAYALMKSKQWLAAETSYLKIFQNKDSSQARTDLAYVYYKKKDYEQALQQFELALDQKPVYLSAYYYRAKTNIRLKKFAEAEKDYLSYIKYFPQHYYAHYRLGFLYLTQKDFTKAVDLFSRASTLASGRNKSRALYFLAKSYQRSGKEYKSQAIEAYQSSIRVSPGETNPRMGIASLLPDTKEGRLEAEELYDQVLRLKPNESRAYFNLAVIYNKQGRSQEAQRAYEKAVEFNPSYVIARYNLGLMLLDKKKWRAAAEQFQAVVNTDPKNAKAYFNLGRAQYRLKDYEQALSNYQRALEKRNGDYPEVAINLGLIYSAKKRFF